MSTPFESQFIKQLRKKMQDEVSYSWSRRVEGMLQQDVNSVAPQRAALVIDADLEQETMKEMIVNVINVLRKDRDFRETAFAVFVWEQDKLSKQKIVASDFIKPRFMEKILEALDISNTSGGTWDNLKEISGPIAKAPLKILLTTADKINSLETSDFIGRNYLIVYSGEEDAISMKTIKRIPCVSHLVERKF